MNHWLFKSEPEVFSIDHLMNSRGQTEPWDGVRNYQARNMLRDSIKLNDLALFYHSNCETPGIVGVMKIVKAGYPDLTALDPQSKYYDPASTKENPRWYRVDVCFVKKFKRVISLHELKCHPALKNMVVARKGNRLSISPVTLDEWQVITSMLD